MPRPIPPPLGLALTILRTAGGWTQVDLARAEGTSGCVISGYETGNRQGLDRERLDELAAAMGYDGAAIDRALLVTAGFSPVPFEPGASAETAAIAAQGAHGAALRLGLLAGDMGESQLRELVRARQADRERLAAARLWEKLAAESRDERRLRIERSPEAQSATMCERLCSESERAAAGDATRALKLAIHARRVAELAPGEPSEKAALLGFSLAFIANAHRVPGDLHAAETVFVEAMKLWRAGTPADSDLLAEWRLLDLEASLRRGQRRFPEALELLERAKAAAPPGQAGRILLKRALTLEQAGAVEAAIGALREAGTLVEEADDPRLAWGIRFNLVANLCHLGRYREAEALLAEVSEKALGLGNDLDLLRVLWLSGRVGAGRGRAREARTALDQARRGFAARRDAYDAALVSLELAVLDLQGGRTAAVRALAEEMLWIFESLGIHREALAALRVFCEAARAGTVTAGLARHLQDFLERARRDPRLRFEDPT